jgi:hypothetical protein
MDFLKGTLFFMIQKIYREIFRGDTAEPSRRFSRWFGEMCYLSVYLWQYIKTLSS